LKRWLSKALERRLRSRKKKVASSGSGRVTLVMTKKRRKHIRIKGFSAR
jgi:hypothetical protein